jgi:hypothetical protein
MKPARNAFLGYTFQKCIAFLILAKMDAEREIQEVEIEASVNHNFDDVKISANDILTYCQIKDIDDISINDLTIADNQIIIKGKLHKLQSDGQNLLFFKNIDITCNTEVLGFPVYKISNVYIISLSREKAETSISCLYKQNEQREYQLKRFFDKRLDERRFVIKREELPSIDIYNIHLLEETVNVGKKLLEFEDILFIEGKPGVGKSHLVTSLKNKYKNSLVYRFWVSNQDKDYEERLIFRNFLSNISKELFNDYRYRTEEEVIEHLSKEIRIVIIDGLDHVENYRQNELQFFINFIDKLKNNCKTIVLSRPLKTELKWTKQQLQNWNSEETKMVLNDLYHISDYHICQSIYDITDGYPILVRFVTEHYKAYNELPLLGKLKDTNEYYEAIASKANIKSALTLFLSSRSFIMESEISLFLDDELSDIVKEFITSYPYLFEIRLNRISLFHDSLNTFLRYKKIDYSGRSTKVKQVVYKSLMNGEKRFMSRFAFFDLDKSMKLEIIRKYASMNCFQDTMKDCIDFEAMRVFYKQIRETLPKLEANELEVINYYDLSLIINILARDQVSTINEFLFIYVKCLQFNGCGKEDITSSEHLFCTYYYYETKDATLLYNLMANGNYDTEHFYRKLEYDVWMEENYFDRHQKTLRKTKRLQSFLNREPISDSYEYVPHILANLYLHETGIKELKELQTAIKTYFDTDNNSGVFLLEKALNQFKVSVHSAQTFLEKAKDIILSLGKDFFPNEYHKNSLRELILINSHHGSFTVWPKVLNYMRLSLYEKRKIDLSNISIFFAMYNMRKDYTVWKIDEALKIFENKGLISIDKSIDLIIYTQSMSEKGIRGLLTNYIELHSPEILSILLDKYHPDNLQITWFDLSKEYINYFSDNLFNYAMYSQLLYWHNHSKEIDCKDIENVFYSNRKMELIDELKSLKYRIRIPENHTFIQELRKFGCFLSTDLPNKENEYDRTAEERYAQGILDSDSIDFIMKNKLSATKIAGYTDGNYSVFADLDIFKAYNKEHVQENVSLILRNALIGKIGTINMFANVFHFPGNLPKFMNDYEVDIDFVRLYNSFMTFMKISLLDIEKEKYNSISWDTVPRITCR